MVLTPDPPGPEDGLTDMVVDALFASETEPTPPPLRPRVLAAATARRPPGRPLGASATELSPVEGYARTIGELNQLLEGLHDDDWRAPVAPYGWDVQGLVGHLVAVERLLATQLGADTLVVAPEVELDHIAMSREVVAAQDGRDPADTLADWIEATVRLREALAGVDLDERVTVHGIDFRWGSLLVTRTLELWTHTDDVRRAVGRSLAEPDAERLAAMTDLAVRTLPLRLAAAGVADATGLVRLVLTGPGGGVWRQPVGPVVDTEAEPDVRVVADAVAFCRLSAGRLSMAELDASIDGDHELATAVLSASAAFAV